MLEQERDQAREAEKAAEAALAQVEEAAEGRFWGETRP